MKSLLLATLTFASALAGNGAILPGVIGPWKLVSAVPLEVNTNRPLWDEYGLEESERATYQKNGAQLGVEAWRLSDSTAAMGAFDFLRPADAKPAPEDFNELTSNVAITQSGALIALGNYVVRFAGPLPEVIPIANMFRSMPRYEHAELPAFVTYMPAKEVPNSEHYIQGPVGLQEFLPGVEPSAAGFHLGAEAAVAAYSSGLKLALFSYPTPAIARDRQAALGKIPGAVVKRTGPLVAFVLNPKDPNAAEDLLTKVRYQATVTTSQPPPSKKDNAGNLLLNIFYLILILAGFCVASGLIFGLFRMVFRRAGPSGEGEEILALHLEQR